MLKEMNSKSNNEKPKKPVSINDQIDELVNKAHDALWNG